MMHNPWSVTLESNSALAHRKMIDTRAAHISFHRPVENKNGRISRVKGWATTIAILPFLLATFALAEDFKTVGGKIYKDATVSRIEADGIELKTKTGISKVYFTELPQDVQERFHWAKPEAPREPFYSRWAAAAEDPAVLAKMIAAGAVVIASVALIINHIRFRRQPTMLTRHEARRRAVHRARS